jgi:ketosteroid isomerase-like protein
MSERNVELARRAVEAFNARDIQAYIEQCDPSIEFHSAFAAVGVAVYRGHEGIRQFFSDTDEVWGEGVAIEPEAYFDLGESTLFFYVLKGRGQQSGVEVAMANAVVSRWRDGLTVYVKVYLDRADALRDLGVSKDELEPIDP